jgi:hypothetical protein
MVPLMALVAVALSAGLTLAGGLPAARDGALPRAGEAGSPAPDASPGAAPSDLWLSGPFGRVAGAVPGAGGWPAGDPGPEPLDAWAMDVPLRLDAGRTGPSLVDWLVTAATPGGGRPAVLADRRPGDAARSPLRFAGPHDPGPYLVTAHATTADGWAASRSWAVVVPDRPLPQDGLLEVTAPDVLLGSGPRTVTGRPGHGCYVYLCVDVGGPPPADTLGALQVGALAPLRLQLSDGSGIVAWAVERRSLDGEGPVTAVGPPRTVGTPVTEVVLEGLPAGEWVVRVALEFDRERGWLEAWFRVVATDDSGG